MTKLFPRRAPLLKIRRVELHLARAGGAGAVVIGGCTDHLKEVADKSFEMAETAVTLALGLIGLMALWLGLMRSEKAGLVRELAACSAPFCAVYSRMSPRIILRWARWC